MSLTLAHGISFVEQDGERVFLDLNRDRYFALDDAADRAFTGLTRGKLDDELEAHLRKLVDANVLADEAFCDNPRPCRQPTINGSALDAAAEFTTSSWQVVAACLSIARAKRRLTARSLAWNVRRLEQFKAAMPEARRAREGEREAIAAAYHTAGRLIATLDECLAVSFAITRHCLKRRLDTRLSFGIKLRPFEAHAWASVDGMLISDRLDNVRPFAAILLI